MCHNIFKELTEDICVSGVSQQIIIRVCVCVCVCHTDCIQGCVGVSQLSYEMCVSQLFDKMGVCGYVCVCHISLTKWVCVSQLFNKMGVCVTALAKWVCGCVFVCHNSDKMGVLSVWLCV